MEVAEEFLKEKKEENQIWTLLNTALSSVKSVRKDLGHLD